MCSVFYFGCFVEFVLRCLVLGSDVGSIFTIFGFGIIWEATPHFLSWPLVVINARNVYLSYSPVFHVFPDLYRVGLVMGG